MNAFRFLAVFILMLTGALQAQAGVMALGEHPRFQLHLDGIYRVLHEPDERDFSHFLPAQTIKLKQYRRLWWNWHLLFARHNVHPVPGVPELPELPPVEQPTAAVWEPPVLGLMVLGLAGLVGARRRLRRLES